MAREEKGNRGCLGANPGMDQTHFKENPKNERKPLLGICLEWSSPLPLANLKRLKPSNVSSKQDDLQNVTAIFFLKCLHDRFELQKCRLDFALCHAKRFQNGAHVTGTRP